MGAKISITIECAKFSDLKMLYVPEFIPIFENLLSCEGSKSFWAVTIFLFKIAKETVVFGLLKKIIYICGIKCFA